MDFPFIVRLFIVVPLCLVILVGFIREWYYDWRDMKEIERLENKVYTEMHN